MINLSIEELQEISALLAEIFAHYCSTEHLDVDKAYRISTLRLRVMLQIDSERDRIKETLT